MLRSPQNAVPEKIYYFEASYKYQLALDYVIQLNIIPPASIRHEYFNFYNTGLLVIKKGYAWDGASGPTLDSTDTMRGSLIHDVFYQMIREDYLPTEYREKADYLLYDILREDGMADFRAWAWLKAVRAFGGGSVLKRSMKSAPTPIIPIKPFYL